MHLDAHALYHLDIAMVIHDFMQLETGAEEIHHRMPVPFHPYIYISALAQRRIGIKDRGRLAFQDAASEAAVDKALVQVCAGLFMECIPRSDLFSHHGPARIDAQRHVHFIVEAVDYREGICQQVVAPGKHEQVIPLFPGTRNLG